MKACLDSREYVDRNASAAANFFAVEIVQDLARVALDLPGYR